VFIGGYIAFFLWATNRLPGVLHAYARSELSSQLVLLVAFFALTWFCAAFIASQWRNLTRLYEGYLFAGPLKGLGQLGKLAHQARRERLMNAGQSLYGRYTLNLPGQQGAEQADQQPDRQAGDARESAEPGDHDAAAYGASFQDEDEELPTRLGNVLRAAEYYPAERYGANYIRTWPRLGHLCPESFLANMDQFQASLDFLVVAATGFSLLAVSTSLTAALTGHGAALFLVCLLGGFALAHVAYASAVGVAEELGEAMRAGFDLYRNELLVRLRWPIPGRPDDEQATWRDLGDFIGEGIPRRIPYSRPYVDIDRSHLL
jgi:hypothetical protein